MPQDSSKQETPPTKHPPPPVFDASARSHGGSGDPLGRSPPNAEPLGRGVTAASCQQNFPPSRVPMLGAIRESTYSARASLPYSAPALTLDANPNQRAAAAAAAVSQSARSPEETPRGSSDGPRHPLDSVKVMPGRLTCAGPLRRDSSRPAWPICGEPLA